MNAPVSPASFWRFITPSTFLLALVLMFLPWIEVRCDGRTGLTQSGFQTIWGGSSKANWVRQEIEEEKQRRKNSILRWSEDDSPSQGESKIAAAPLMAAYLTFLIVGAILGFQLPLGGRRLAALGAFSVVAAGILLVQTAIGFPLMNKFLDLPGKPPDGGPSIFNGFSVGNAENGVRHTIWFFLGWLAILGSIPAFLLEAILTRGRLGTTPEEQTVLVEEIPKPPIGFARTPDERIALPKPQDERITEFP